MAESIKLHVKNMVCPRCLTAVEQIVERLEIPYANVALGEIDLKHAIDDESKKRLSEALENLIVQKIHHSQDVLEVKWADFIADQLNYDYKYLGMLFSSVESITLEQYIIRQKIERIKELLIYDELSLSQIAYQLGYSSVAHLSSQFKKVNGMTPSNFKGTIDKKRNTLDNI